MKFFFTILLGILIKSACYAQTEDFGDPQEFRIPADSTAAPTQNGTLETFKTIFEGKPGKAVTYGLIIPAGGQLYNKRYWKAPLVWAADATAIYYFVRNRSLWLGFQEALEIKIEDPTYVYLGISSEESIRQFRNQFQLDTERAGIAIIIIHLASVIEAFTDRHLMEFDTTEDLSIGIQPQIYPFYGSSASIGVTYKF
jgi:hypothetical protein